MPDLGSGAQLSFPAGQSGAVIYDNPRNPTGNYIIGTESVDPVSGEVLSDAGVAIDPPVPVAEVFDDDPMYNWLYKFVVTVFGKLLGLAGILMSYGMNEFVLGFSDQYFNKNVGFAVESVWTVVRDLFNLTFIFGLVYIGFKMILDSSDARARSMLVSLIAAALLVNFSLFIVKFIIDLANITAVMIASAGFGGQDIANAFLNLLNLATVLQITQPQINHLENTGAAFAYIFGILIFISIAAFVFAAAGILFIVRFVVLNIYLVFSPVLFIGWVFPSMQSYSSKYWHGLLGNAFFAPAYLMMIYLSYIVLDSYQLNLGSKIDYSRILADTGTTNNSAAVFATIPFFVLAMVFMIMSLVVAKKMGAVGASTAISIGNKWRGNAQGLLYRNTGGRFSKSTLDFMDRKGISNLPGTRALRSGLKSGYEYGAGGTSLAKTRSDIESEQADITKNRSRMQGLKDTKSGKKQVATAANNSAELATLRGLPYAGLSSDQKLRLNELESDQAKADKFITGLDKGEIEALTPVERAKYSTRFSADQVGKIMESDKISTVEKNKVFGARVDSISAKIGGATPTAAKVTKLSRDELDTLGFDWAAKNAHMLTQTQFDDYIKNSKKVTPEIAESLKNRRKNELLLQIEGGTPQASSILSELAKKPGEFVQLPTEVFTTPTTYNAIIPHLTTGIMEELAKSKLDQTQRFDMKTYLSRAGRGTPGDVIAYLSSIEGIKKYGP